MHHVTLLKLNSCSASLPFIRTDPDFPQPLIDWGLYTEPQVSGEILRYTQGRNLGGSSGRNQMLYHRATKGSYDMFANVTGDQAYTYSNMERFFQRSINFSDNADKRMEGYNPNYDAAAFSREGGPLHVTYPTEISPFAQYGPAAFSAVGMKSQDGSSSGVLDGYAWWQYTIDPATGLRSSSESSFLTKAFERPSLTTYVNAQARNIIFENMKATGVNVTIGGLYPFTLAARKEVIVSAGVWHSPQLLMVSGIGPANTLQKFNIPVVSDLAGVGQNMWDTCAIQGPRYEIEVPEFSAQATVPQAHRMHQAVEALLANGTGPLTNEGSNVVGWYHFPESRRENLTAAARLALDKFPSDWPEVEFNLATSATVLSITNETMLTGTISASLIKPLSRGNMTIRSASNLDAPIINPNWLRDPVDQEVAVQAYKTARDMWQAIPVRKGEEIFPGGNVTTDAQLLETVIGQVSVIHHSSASCAMGKSDNPQAVVDSKGRVFGVQKLRVIDSSSLPFTPPGHTQGTTYAHAEKLVQDVLDALNEE